MKNLKYPKKQAPAGFSLIEILMMMLILSVVALPLMMLISAQRQMIQTSQYSFYLQQQANILFDNINPSNPDAINDYTITGDPNASNNYTSVTCDPAEKSLSLNTSTNKSFAYSNPFAINKGCKASQGPFFTRIVDYTKDAGGNKTYEGLTVTVNLFNSATPGATPIYSSTRQYDFNNFQINPGVLLTFYGNFSGNFNNITPAETISNAQMEIPEFDRLINANLTPTYPLTASQLTSIATDHHNQNSVIYYEIDSGSADHYIGDHSLDTILPNPTGKIIADGPDTYYFQLMSNTTYSITINFLYTYKTVTQYGGANDDINGQTYYPISTAGFFPSGSHAPATCTTGATNMSCEQVNIDATVYEYGSTGSVVKTTDLATYNNFDIAAPIQGTYSSSNNVNNMIVPFTFKITTPAVQAAGNTSTLALAFQAPTNIVNPSATAWYYSVLNSIQVKRLSQ